MAAAHRRDVAERYEPRKPVMSGCGGGPLTDPDGGQSLTTASRWRGWSVTRPEPENGGSTGAGQRAGPAVGAQIGEAIGRSRGGPSTRSGRRQPATASPAGPHPDQPARAWCAAQATGPADLRIRTGATPTTRHAARYGSGRPPRRQGQQRWAPADLESFGRAAYKRRNVVERCFNRFKQWRDLATLHAKRAAIYHASLLLIAAIMWLS
ncbi:hypothetical protein GCM10018962_95020 [Dactylosporangium matsuzakiense]|uniref:Transposase n=1 Tax=Dactylosporangium matsuzakiense TaxID=53360 RepID=A0A9W6KS27_9ACTN|nr:hypothetical protein GCM10017581_088330 [Dactylosporangium matsuzakiense]